MWGIGLAGFVQGVESGVALRDKIDTQREKRSNKRALDAIEKDTQAGFNQAVANGEVSADSYTDYWTKYGLPKKVGELIKQGDYQGAKELREWGMSDAAQKGATLYKSAALKAQTGDPAGALQDALKAAQVDGYIQHDFEVLSQDDVVDPNGNLIAYRIKFRRGKDGKVEVQDIKPDDVPRVISIFANPEAAFQTHLQRQAQEAADAKEEDKRQQVRGEEMSDFKEKELWKEKIKGNENDRAKAYKAMFDTLSETNTEFAYKMTPEQQDQAVRDMLARVGAYEDEGKSQGGDVAPQAPGLTAAGSGGSNTPAGITAPRQMKLLIDTKNGQPVNQPAPAATPAAVNAPAGIAPAQATPAAPSTQWKPTDNGGMVRTDQQGQTREYDPQMVEAARSAKKRIAAGEDAQAVRNGLVQQGIDPALLDQL